MSNLLAKVKAKSAERRQAAAAKYRELLGRFERPAAGDETELAGVMAVLGVSLDDLSEHASLVARIAECERLADNISTLDADLQGKHVEWIRALEWAEKARADLERQIKAKVERLQAARDAAEASSKDATHALGELTQLRDAWTAVEEGADVEDVRAARRAAEVAAAPVPVHGSGRRGPEHVLTPQVDHPA